ncbi:MAG: hypothetical protein RIR09_319 [Pseudomonadota bacterium]
MKQLSIFLKRLFGSTPREPRLQSYRKQQEKFYAAYPLYTLGFASYGFPIVHDDNEGTTLKIGAFCSIGGGVQIFLGKNHRTDWISSYPFPAFFEEARGIADYSTSKGDVTIGSDVWLCADSIVLSGVRIGHGAVVAAGAVVTQNVEPYSVVAGNPARHVRWRFDEETRSALLQTAWWDWPEAEIRQNVALFCTNNIAPLLEYATCRTEKHTT